MKLSKTQFASVVIICILSTTLLTTYFGFILGLDVGDVSTFYLDRGPRYESTYVVGVWNSTHYYAMNGTTGQREYLGSNFTSIMENCLAKMSMLGGCLYVREGVYTLDGPLNIPDNTMVSGASWVSTQITLKNNANGDGVMFRNDNPQQFASGIGNHNITIQNLLLDGNKNNQAGGQGYLGLIDFNNTISAVVQNCHIRNSNNNGIRIVNRGVSRIMNNWIQFHNGSGLHLGTHSDDSYIAFNDFGSCELHGIEGSGGGHQHIIGNNIGGHTYDGIKLTGGGANIIENNRIMLIGRIGIAVTRCRRMQICNNILLQCDESGTYFGGGVKLDGDADWTTNETLITGNHFKLCYRGLELYNNTYNSTISSNVFSDMVDRPIYERYFCDYNFFSSVNCFNPGLSWGLVGQHSVITNSWNGTHFIENQWWNATGSNWEVETLPP